MNDIPISKDRFRRAILCSLSLLGQGRPELRCGTGTVRCLDSAVTLACLLSLSTPKITFFSDRTSLALPSAFVRLGSFKRGSMYMNPHAASTPFFRFFYDCLQSYFHQQDKNTLLLVFLFFPPPSPPRGRLSGAQKDNGHSIVQRPANHAMISRNSL